MPRSEPKCHIRYKKRREEEPARHLFKVLTRYRAKVVTR